MGHLEALAHNVVDVVRSHRHWMGWNTFLALVPAGLALLLLWRPHRRTLGWWAGIAVFALFLPNAPYVITDLIHLRWMVAAAPGESGVILGVLPLMATFVAVGYTSYLVCLELIVREVRSVRPAAPRWMIELPVHAVCSLGIVLGRITRLNSWDTVTTPRWTAERIFNTLTWRGAPVALVAVFVAVVLTTTVMRILWDAVLRTGRGAAQRVGAGAPRRRLPI